MQHIMLYTLCCKHYHSLLSSSTVSHTCLDFLTELYVTSVLLLSLNVNSSCSGACHQQALPELRNKQQQCYVSLMSLFYSQSWIFILMYFYVRCIFFSYTDRTSYSEATSCDVLMVHIQYECSLV